MFEFIVLAVSNYAVAFTLAGMVVTSFIASPVDKTKPSDTTTDIKTAIEASIAPSKEPTPTFAVSEEADVTIPTPTKSVTNAQQNNSANSNSVTPTNAISNETPTTTPTTTPAPTGSSGPKFSFDGGGCTATSNNPTFPTNGKIKYSISNGAISLKVEKNGGGSIFNQQNVSGGGEIGINEAGNYTISVDPNKSGSCPNWSFSIEY